MNRRKELRFTIPDFEESCHLYDGPEFEGESERAEAADLDGDAALPPVPAVGLLFDLLPDDLLVGEVAAGLAVILLHASSS